MSKELRKQLELEEGRIKYAYTDHLGYWTIGVGRLIDKHKGGGLRDSEIDLLLTNDIMQIMDELLLDYPWMRSLSQVRLDAIVQARFQLGRAGLAGFVNTLAALRQGNWEATAKGMKQSLWAQQTPGRVNRLAEQITTNQYVYKDN